MYVGGGRTRRALSRIAFAPVVAAVLAVPAGCKDRQAEPDRSFAEAAAPSKPVAASSAAPSASSRPSFPGAPALLPDETPPPKSINYFEPHEMTAGGLASAYDSCLASGSKADPSITTEKIVAYCSCIVDAWRASTHSAPDPMHAPPPTREQMSQCGAAVRSEDSGSPFAVPFPKSTPDLYKAWQGCLERFGSIDHGVFCGCYVDAVFRNPQKLAISPVDQARCELADQYWNVMKAHMTQRQFDGLIDAGTSQPSDVGLRDAASIKGR